MPVASRVAGAQVANAGAGLTRRCLLAAVGCYFVNFLINLSIPATPIPLPGEGEGSTKKGPSLEVGHV